MGSICHLAEEFPLAHDMYERSGAMFLRDKDSIPYFYALNDMAYELAEQIKDDIVAGAIGSAVGGVVSSYVKKSSGYKSALKKLNRAERMAENSQRASRTQALQEAENTVENYGAEKSQAYSSGATEAVKATRNATDNNQ
jgi:hypothetical protein